MSRTAIGMIETVGLLAAYEAADVAVKSANVKLVGYEKSSGGMVVIKISGDIGAVKSAVDAAVAAASRLGKVFSSHVIPRPNQDVNKKMISTENTVGYQKDITPVEGTEKKEEDQNKLEIKESKEETEKEIKTTESEISESETEEELGSEAEKTDEEEFDEEETEAGEEIEDETEAEKKDDEDICNLCGDPDCPRRKGELRTDCIHYDEIMGEDE
ncbi:MAG: BMC domain-containing protein [Halanaerobium sp.]